jgi:hypothetical protein
MKQIKESTVCKQINARRGLTAADARAVEEEEEVDAYDLVRL